jgi:hypothetical protein
MINKQTAGNVSVEKGTVWDEVLAVVEGFARLEAKRDVERMDEAEFSIRPELTSSPDSSRSVPTGSWRVYVEDEPFGIFSTECEARRVSGMLEEALEMQRERVLWYFADRLEQIRKGEYGSGG